MYSQKWYCKKSNSFLISQPTKKYMIEHVVSRLGSYTIEFQGGAFVEIEPPAKLSIGDTVQIEISGIMRRSINSMKWIDTENMPHFISYDPSGNPR
jgi:hypothetical protein